jgi:nucleoside 2-deoxyribosyltransferase
MSKRSVVICGSKRFAAEMSLMASNLRSSGVIVFEPNLAEPILEVMPDHPGHIHRMALKGATLEHFEWIRRADVCYVYNKEDYCGVSVTMEMGFAFALSKPIFALRPRTGDPCRDGLIDFVVGDVADLVKLL